MPEGLAIVVVLLVLVLGRRVISQLLSGTSYYELRQARQEIKRESRHPDWDEMVKVKAQIEETAGQEAETAAWVRKRTEELMRSKQAFLDAVHIALRPSGEGAKLWLVLLTGLPYEQLPRYQWASSLDSSLKVGEDKFGRDRAALEELVRNAQGLIARRLGLRDPVLAQASGTVLLVDPPIPADIPQLPGFPWDGSPVPAHDRELLARFKAEQESRLPAIRAARESIEAKLRKWDTELPK